MFGLLTASQSLPHGSDLAAAPNHPGTRLASSPPIWLQEDFFSNNHVQEVLSRIPKEEAAWEPCVGQTKEFASKRCTMLPVKGDSFMDGMLNKIESAWDIDVGALRNGLPVIRYLPGAPPVGLHGDMGHDGLVPNATLVMYLTDTDKNEDGSATGQTIFPDAHVAVTPRAGSLLSFQNTDELGRPHPHSRHSVGEVPKHAKKDRLVVQIPVIHEVGKRARAYPEHVSGPGKAPGEHEAKHGNAEQKAAYQAAIAAGCSIAAAYLAAKAGKYDESDKEQLEEAAKK